MLWRLIDIGSALRVQWCTHRTIWNQLPVLRALADTCLPLLVVDVMVYKCSVDFAVQGTEVFFFFWGGGCYVIIFFFNYTYSLYIFIHFNLILIHYYKFILFCFYYYLSCIFIIYFYYFYCSFLCVGVKLLLHNLDALFWTACRLAKPRSTRPYLKFGRGPFSPTRTAL